MHRKVGIVTECVCDLPKKLLNRYDIQIIYFLVRTNRGSFYDTEEITARNVLEYMEREGQNVISKEPEPEIYRQIYENALETYDELVHVAISGRISKSCEAAEKATADMKEEGKRVHIFDSGQLSTGQGQLVLLAAQMAEEGASTEEILAKLEESRNRVSTSFVVEQVDSLYYNGHLSERVRKLCHRYSLHPVLSMKNGELALHSILRGSYERVCREYIRRALKKPKRIDQRRMFLTHAGCSEKMLEQIRREIGAYCRPEELIVTEASATVSGNCGSNAFGILFLESEV